MEIKPISLDTGSAGIVMSIPPGPDLPAKKSETSPEKTSTGEGASLTNEQIKKMAKQIEDQLSSMNISLNFTPYGQRNEKMAVIVSDEKTGKVIREIPPKELQNLYEKMNELIGIIFNHSA